MKKIISILLFLLSSLALFSQEDRGTIVDYIPQQNKDTLKVTRWYGDWWFGLGVSTQFNQYFGNFYAPSIVAAAPNQTFNPEFEFIDGSGFGFSLGAIVEYNPIGSSHGGFLSLNYTNRGYNTETAIISKSDQRKYLIESQLRYLEIRPTYRYDFGFWHLYGFIGPTFDIFLNQETSHYLSFVNTGDIDQKNIYEINNPKTRIGLDLGVGFDLFVADLNGLRFRISPYISADFGTDLLGTQNKGIKESAVNLASARIGVSLKLGPDHRLYDTLKYDPSYHGTDYQIATLNNNIDLNDDLTNNLVNPLDIAYYDLPEPIEVVREEPLVVRSKPVEEVKSNIKVQTNRLQFFEYPSSEVTQLTPELQSYLNSVAQYMLDHPKSEIRIVGHSDNMGTPEQNQRRSVIRKDRVVQYLLAKGINRYRIFDRGEGARRPIADNKTEAGRKKNRRVEITIVQ